MIHELKNITPHIDFGLGYLERQAAAGETVTVWLQTLYNQKEYEFVLHCTGTVTKISNYEYSVSFDGPGSYTLQLAVSTTGKTKTLLSNVLEVVVT